jgi:quinate dehydrogenase (quinone)|tara:strand:- start:4343 stop:6652 length:2310 start_codon:yes stop_codon:yes gene_type:complete
MIFLRIYAILIGLLALALLIPGGNLILHGGSVFYLIAGVIMLGSSVQLFRRRAVALLIYAVLLFYTLAWALYESGLWFWALAPRLWLLSVLALVFLIPAVQRQLTIGEIKLPVYSVAASLLAIIAVILSAYVSMMNGLSVSEDVFASRDRQTNHNSATETNWLAYGNSRRGSRYSPIEEINRDNVQQLEVAWTFRTGVSGTFKNTPIQVGDKLYACAGGNVIIALDAENGEEVWRYDAGVSEQVKRAFSYFTTTCRGVSYYAAPSDYSGECPTRILMGTTDARLLAVDALNGEACASFGTNGQIDLKHKLGEVKNLFYFVTSSPSIVRGNAVVGGWVMDNYEVNEPSGVVRAFDAISGEFAWAWDMGRPDDHGEPEGEAIYTRGTPNVWSLFSVDEERGIVYAPLGNETPDYFGAHRHEASEQHASSVVAIDGETGALIWSFQTAHHDIWDWDVPSQPVLVDVPDDTGRLIPAVVQATKRGEVFLLNRETGEPIATVEERPVPQGGVPEDWTAPTQPYSALPNVLLGGIQEEDMWGVTLFDQLACRISYKQMRYEGDFTPPSTVPTFQYPSNGGGYNWGSVSVDEKQHIMVGNLMNLGSRTRLVPRAEMEAGAGGSPQLGTPYGIQTPMFTSPIGVPCNEPPYGLLVAIDLQQQNLIWKRSIGTGHKLGGLPLEIGTPALAGSIVTAGGVIFFGATWDGFFRALDLYTGEELWRFELPNSGQATPMTYLTPNSGEQLVIMTVPGADVGPLSASVETTGLGGYIFAFKLP